MRLGGHLFFAGALTLLASVAQASPVVIGGFDGSRVLFEAYSVYDPSGANNELTNPANFGLYGDSLVFAPSTTTATSAYLSGIDIFFTGLLNFDSAALTGAEITALTSFINSGGVVIAYGDNFLFDETVDGLLNAFGLDVNNTAHNNAMTLIDISNPSHPIMDGPFGIVGNHAISDSAYLTPGSPNIIGSYVNGFGAIAAVGPGGGQAGALIFFPDSESYGLSENDFGGVTDTRTLFNNTVAWSVGIANTAAVPEPASLLLLGSGLAAAAAKVRRRRKQQAQQVQ